MKVISFTFLSFLAIFTGANQTFALGVNNHIDSILEEAAQRYRDTETGTFITRDPLGFIDGPNVYTYVNQNPWTKFDPTGLFEVDDVKGLRGFTFDESGNAIPMPTEQARQQMQSIGDSIESSVASGVSASVDQVVDRHMPSPSDPKAQLDSVVDIAVDAAIGRVMVGPGLLKPKLTPKTPVTPGGQTAKEVIELTPQQQQKLNKFNKKLPKAADTSKTSVDQVGDDALFTNEVPGTVPGSSKVYQKTVDESGATTSHTKTTKTPDADFKKVTETDLENKVEKVVHEE